jgi:hypothetical protein
MPSKGKSILVSLPKHLARTHQQWRTQTPPLQQKYSALQLRVPGQAPPCLFPTYFSLGKTIDLCFPMVLIARV